MANNVNPLDNPMLRGVERLSPAMSLDFVVGYDDEGWEVWRTFSVDDLVVNERGELFRVVGFTLDNEVIAKPHGLGHNPIISAIMYLPEGLDHLPQPEMIYRHSDGLIAFGG